MRRKPFSFIYIGVLATFSFANAVYAKALSTPPAENCNKCHAEMQQSGEVYSQISQGAHKQISGEPVAMNNYSPSYFGDEDPAAAAKKSARQRDRVVKEYEEGQAAQVHRHHKAVRHYEEQPMPTRRHHNVVREYEKAHPRRHNTVERKYEEPHPVHTRRHHALVREYEEYQPVHGRRHHGVVEHYEQPISSPVRAHANRQQGSVVDRSRSHRGQVLSLESPKYVMHRPKQHIPHHPNNITHVAPFRHIVADSDINIVLNNATRPCIEVLSRDCCGRRLVNCSVKNGTLYLSDLTKRSCKTYSDPDPNSKACQVTTRPLQVIINTNCVESVRLHEQSSIYAAHYRTAKMSVKSYTSGTIMLHGELNPYNIEQYGSGFINICNVNTSNLDITSQGPGLIRLAGKVDTLHVRGLVNAQIDAKFLRARDAWIEATGFSEVAVTADNALDGYATGSSYVYYYKTPQFFQPLTYEHANVMQMAYWN